MCTAPRLPQWSHIIQPEYITRGNGPVSLFISVHLSTISTVSISHQPITIVSVNHITSLIFYHLSTDLYHLSHGLSKPQGPHSVWFHRHGHPEKGGLETEGRLAVAWGWHKECRGSGEWVPVLMDKNILKLDFDDGYTMQRCTSRLYIVTLLI